MSPDGELPPELQPFAAAIEATRKRIVAIGVEEEAPGSPLASRLGGTPWWPAARPYPLDRRGRPLLLLTQINFAEAPALEQFPSEGVLQLFIGTDDLMGMNLDALLQPTGFLCAYHTDLSLQRRQDFPELRFGTQDRSPLEDPLTARALSFALDAMPVDPGDYRFADLLPAIAADEHLTEFYGETFWAPFMRIGGYPSFTQEDPRVDRAGPPLGDVSLLTLDTWEGIMWGDSGVAQFFMHEQDLKNRDFSKVAYHWDCH